MQTRREHIAMKASGRPAAVLAIAFAISSQAVPQQPEPPRQDAAGNPIRRAPTGHVSNYDEAKVGNYKLPDPLVLADGRPVRDAKTWTERRRGEILELYKTHVYGRVPERAPKASFEVAENEPGALEGAAIRKRIVVRFGDGAAGPAANVTLYVPAKARGPVPVILHLMFGPRPSNQPARPSETGPLADILSRGYGYAHFRYTEVQLDSAGSAGSGVIALSVAPGQTKPEPDQWGTITAWAWAASRVLDALEADPAVDARRVAVMGHSRLGKTALWAGALDPRFALVFASCSGEMGASLARRDYGETIDDVAANFPWWMAGNFQKFSGRWGDMPVDAHMLIALNAPRPVFITGGTQDQWADPHGMFLAAVAAGPVYRLMGKGDLGATTLTVDTPLVTGSLGFHYHTGGHTISPADWSAFLAFADRHLKEK
jgi:hypothetical protein